MKYPKWERDVSKFWLHVDVTSGCWNWTRPRNGHGNYGMIYADGGHRLAHRFSYRIHNGYEDIPQGINVLHKCDIPLCVNPSHLFLGTQLDNMLDKKEKGRCNAMSGENHPRRRLSAQDVSEIRARLGIDRGCDLAIEYGVAGSTISAIKTGHYWKEAA